MIKNKRKDWRKAINATSSWESLRKIFTNKKYKIVFLWYNHENRNNKNKFRFQLSNPLAYEDKYRKRFLRKVKKNTNGGGERAIERISRKKLSKRNLIERIGKSSRKYSRMKKEWWNYSE